MPDDRFLVLRLKIHCWAVASQWNAVSAVAETMASLTEALVFGALVTFSNLRTTPALPTELPSTSHTRNLMGTVLPCLKTLDPSELTGCRTSWPGAPLHVVPLGSY